jgi:PAS domain S-box-containing protein
MHRMEDQDKTKEQLMNELAELRQRVAELEAGDTECAQAEETLRGSEQHYRQLFEGIGDAVMVYSHKKLLRLGAADIVHPDFHQLMEEELRGSEARYRELADSIADVFFAFDKDLKYTYWNKASEKLTGIPAKDAIGKSLYELFPDTPETRRAERAYLDVLRTQQPLSLVNPYHIGGKDFFFEISAYPSERGLSVFVKDITERKRVEEELQQSFEKLQRTFEGTVNVLVSVVEIRDPYTAGHQRRVTQLACAIAKEMGLSEGQIGGIHMAGLIHDIGKISVPAEILSKPSPLTELEYGLIKMHPQVGYDILNGTIEFPWPVAQIILQHHERMDGSGYPQRLSGEAILLEARILGLADVIEAMASHRPYRSALGIDKALEETSQNKGVLYDPEVVDVCSKIFTEKGFEFE